MLNIENQAAPAKAFIDMKSSHFHRGTKCRLLAFIASIVTLIGCDEDVRCLKKTACSRLSSNLSG